MNRFFKLVHMEVHRFRYMLAGLMAATAIVQIVVLIVTLLDEISMRKDAALRHEAFNNGNVHFPGGKLSFVQAIFNTPSWYTVPIVLCAAAMAVYLFLIWYRDWLGGSTFIYRLLMLPQARRHIYLAKLSAFLLFVFGLVSFQLLLLLAQSLIYRLIVPADMQQPSVFADAIEANQALLLLLPHQFVAFAVRFGLGIVAVLVLFTAILFERSFRLIGILYGILYAAACLTAVVLPLLLLDRHTPGGGLYPGEFAAIEAIIVGVVAGLSLWLGFRLLARKITV